MKTLLQCVSTWQVYWCLVVLSLLSSCQKEEPEFIKPYDLIQGQWQITSDKTEYYDASGALVHELPHDITTDNTITVDISDFAIYKVNANAKTHWLTYSLTQQGKKVFMSVVGSNLNTQFEITKLTDQNMTWQSDPTSGSYLENGTIISVPKTLIVIKFHK